MVIDAKTSIEDIISLVVGPYFGSGNCYDESVAAWIKENCRSYDGNAGIILEKVLPYSLEEKFPLTITEILKLITAEPRRFLDGNGKEYKAIFNSRNRAPWAWKAFFKNAQKVNRFEDWALLAEDLGYPGFSLDFRDSTELLDIALNNMRKTAKPGDLEKMNLI